MALDIEGCHETLTELAFYQLIDYASDGTARADSRPSKP